MKYKRLTEAGWRNIAPWEKCGQDYYCVYSITSSCSNSCAVLKIYNRLAELEDKIENGTLVEFPVLEKELSDYWTLWYIDEKGDIQFESFEATKEEAEARLKEIKENK